MQAEMDGRIVLLHLRQALGRPDGLFMLAANMLPVVGVFTAGWDAFSVVVFYWCETLIVAFWSLVRLGAATKGNILDKLTQPLLVTLHAGAFMYVHLILIHSAFGGHPGASFGAVPGLVFARVMEQGLWVPLAGLFAVRGILTLFELRTPPESHPVMGLYVRIVVMQLTVIFGGFLAFIIGTVAGVILLAVVKSVADLLAEPIIAWLRKMEPGNATPPGPR
ncbi:hypothetical protein EMQ25_03520 [Arsenicitalea aurantiaca]|uniref:Uncharacterized protein n=1 Tax=Arsenicitalea aurantiaca TaxID=1783274 RepID=A0A433XLZ7_9HYPH|nr:DUF6498-containing protein [Arsenicitalea aurantiaca]RUT35034.1 hypothetical protein EMQ25_03520 [Arsenicitalea aurantiaca]